MNYINSANQVVAIQAIREAHQNMSIPDGADLTDIGYRKFINTPRPTDYNALTHDVREVDPVEVNGAVERRWEVFALEPDQAAARLSAARDVAWEGIKSERDRRKFLGVKVGQHWFHSDDSSRIQQLALTMMGASMPPGMQWKVLTLTPPPVFVEMTPALAMGIFQATAASDQAIFAAAEVHRLAMEASADPGAYDFSGGWPATIYDEGL